MSEYVGYRKQFKALVRGRINGMDYLKYSFLLMCLVVLRAEYAYHRSHYRAGRLWCKVVECDQGEEVELCSRDSPETTRCAPCHPDTFMSRSTRSTEGKRCRNKRVCSRNEGLLLWKENDSTKNRQCLCDISLGYYSMDFNPTDPDYSTENCVFCTRKDSYIDPDRGCSPCLGVVYLDSDGYKRCNPNTSTGTETTLAGVQDVRPDDSVAEGLDSKVAVIDESSAVSKDSLSSSQIGVTIGVGVGLILVTTCIVIFIRRLHISRRNRRRASSIIPGTPPLHVARPKRDGTPESQPVLADVEPIPPRPQTADRPLHQAAGTISPTTSYNLLSDGPITLETDHVNTNDSGTKPAENGRPNIHCVNFIANGNLVKVRGDYKRMFAKGNIDNSVIGQRLANGHKTDNSAEEPTEVTINIKPATADTPNLNGIESPSAAPETMYSLVEPTAHPIQEIGESRPPPSRPMAAGTENNENTVPKQL